MIIEVGVRIVARASLSLHKQSRFKPVLLWFYIHINPPLREGSKPNRDNFAHRLERLLTIKCFWEVYMFDFHPIHRVWWFVIVPPLIYTWKHYMLQIQICIYTIRANGRTQHACCIKRYVVARPFNYARWSRVHSHKSESKVYVCVCVASCHVFDDAF